MSSPSLVAEPLSAAELDRRLERAVYEHERSERLICVYLNQLNRRELYRDFGFENVYDYALERFGFCRSKTRSLLYLGRRLSRLPALTEALAKGRLGWTKAAKVASVATPETETAWVERAVASSYRDLERRIRDELPAGGGRVSIYLTAEQAAVWSQALEICRRLSGEEIDAGLALEYVAGEFLATYLASSHAVEEPDRDLDAEPLSRGIPPDRADAPDVVDETRERHLCPDGDATDLPSVEARPYRETHRTVLERDRWRCQYPGCSVRAGLHVHHIEHRSRFGPKRREEMNDPANLVVLCWFHHRLLHAEIIGLTGRAPGGLRWRRPALLTNAVERHDAIVNAPNVWQSDVAPRERATVGL